jgi:hypothetical protein
MWVHSRAPVSRGLLYFETGHRRGDFAAESSVNLARGQAAEFDHTLLGSAADVFIGIALGGDERLQTAQDVDRQIAPGPARNCRAFCGARLRVRDSQELVHVWVHLSVSSFGPSLLIAKFMPLRTDSQMSDFSMRDCWRAP